jgi:hypothetical protein
MREIDCAHSLTLKMLVLIQVKNAEMTIFASKTQFFLESGKHLQDSGMHAIDPPYKITRIGVFFTKKFLGYNVWQIFDKFSFSTFF